MFAGIDDLESAKGDLSDLVGFAEHPFTLRSLALVQKRLPAEVGAVYGHAVDFWRDLPARSRFASLGENPAEVFQLHQSERARTTRIEPPSLAMQVRLAEEWLRDALDDKAPALASPPEIDQKKTVAAIRLMRLHDAVLLSLAGLYKVSASRRRVLFELTDVGRRSMIRRHWAMLFERGSQVALHQQIVTVVEALAPRNEKGGSIVDVLPEPLWKALELQFMDRFFSFGSGVAEKSPYPDALRRVAAYCRWFAALEIVRVSGEITLHVEPDRAKATGLDLSLLAELEADRRDAPYQDKGIYRQGDGLSLGDISLAHAIEVGKSVVLPDRIYEPLADWLQGDFAIAYLQSYASPQDYLVRQGFKRKAENGRPRFDCDFSFYDCKRRLFFFVQAKLKRSSRLATVSNEIRTLTVKNSAATKGYEQIVQLRNRIEEAPVVDAIRSRFPELSIDAQTLARNSRYLVVHNIPELNGLERNGVVMYEWNMFRNLLARGSMTATRIGSTLQVDTPWRANEVLAIENVDAIFAHYGAGMNLAKSSIDEVFSDYADGQMTFTLPRNGSWFTRCLGREMQVRAPLL